LQVKILEQEQSLPIFVHASKLEGLEFEDRDSFIPHLVKLLELKLPKAQVTAFLKKHFDYVPCLITKQAVCECQKTFPAPEAA